MIKVNFIKSLKGRLIAYFLLISIIQAAIIGGFNYINSKKLLQGDANDRLTFIRDTKKKELQEYLNVSRNKISYMAQEAIVEDAVAEFINAQNNNSYNSVYDKYNPIFSKYVNKISCSDILFVDSNSGNIVYSVAKESDYRANLLTANYKNTNIAKAFTAAKESNDKNFTVITDYEFYSPSNNKPIMFMGAPVFKQNVKIGVLIFKMETTEIDKLISNNNKWETLKLGNSGDIILIGDDYKVRNNTRFLGNSKDENIKASKSEVLLKEIKTIGTENVISGKTDMESYTDYNGNKAIAAFTPLNIDNLNWGILVKIDQQEAFQSIYKLERIMMYVLIFTLVAVGLFSMIISSSISSPIIKMSKVAREISQGDLTVELPARKRSDEIGILTQAIKAMLDNLREQTKETISVVNVLASSVSEITVSLTQVTAGASETSSAVTETTATVEEVKQTVYVSSEKTKNVSSNAKQSLEISKAGNKASENTVESMKVINEQMQAIAESIIALSEQSQNISELIESVDNISEQSNILAVNASIEAAKAGDHGKGFSIVAQEIRNLAEQSKQGTKQVRNILKDVQKAANTAVMTTEKGIKLVESGMKQASEAGYAIQKLTESIDISAQMALLIETSSQQQLVGMDQVAIAMEGINEASIQNLSSMKQLEEATLNLQEMGQRIKQLTEKYRV